MSRSSTARPRITSRSIFKRFSFFLKALWIFSPGIIFLVVGMFLLTTLSQGKDIMYQSTDGAASWRTALYLVLAAIFWVFTTWYTSRLIAYNRTDLYEQAPWVLYHFPRLLGYCIFLVLWLGVFLIDDIEGKKTAQAWVIFIIDLSVYIVFYRYLERSLEGRISRSRRKKIVLIQRIVRLLILLACLWIIIRWKNNNVGVLLYTIPVFQLGFLFLVISRRPVYISSTSYANREVTVSRSKPANIWEKYMRWAFLDTSTKFDLKFERSVFTIYHIIAFIAFVCYLLSINHLPFARELTSFPLVLLGFGILLGIINIIALMSYRRQVNFNFLLIMLIVLAGFVFETHEVRLKPAPEDSIRVFDRRMSFQKYTESWIRWHQAELDKDSAPFPVFFILADGGASRSGYWAASVLATLHERTVYDTSQKRSFFMDHLFCLSGASGGSVGNTAFLSSFAIQQQHKEMNTLALCREYLGNDFLVFPLARMLGPELIHPVFGWLGSWNDRAGALEEGMEYPQNDANGMGKWMRGSFTQLLPGDANRFPVLSINTTRVNDGGPGLVSTIHIDSSRGVFGSRVDVLDSVPAGKDMRISTAMVLGARFPYMSPGGKLSNSYYVDGGYFDNSGAGVVHEMLMELNRMSGDSLHPYSRYLKRLHFYVIHLSNTPYSPPGENDPIHPVMNDLATPLLTLAGSYNSQTSVNDARLINYLKEINKERDGYILVNLYHKDSVESLPMNWVMSNKVRSVMDKRIAEKRSLDSLVLRMKERRLDYLFHGLSSAK